MTELLRKYHLGRLETFKKSKESTRPVIGLTATSSTSTRPYVQGIMAAGGIPLIIPTTSDYAVLDRIFPLLDGLLLSGGVDVHPANYGQTKEVGCGYSDILRDEMELELLTNAEEYKVPVLGICRGSQIMNVAFGGTLVQDLAYDYGTAIDHGGSMLEPARPTHNIEVKAKTLLEAILGTPTIRANSLHHQAVDRVAKGFRINSWAEDGTVEGIEAIQGTFRLGLQCHPEHLYLNDSRWFGIFKAFIKAASKTAEGGELYSESTVEAVVKNAEKSLEATARSYYKGYTSSGYQLPAYKTISTGTAGTANKAPTCAYYNNGSMGGSMGITTRTTGEVVQAVPLEQAPVSAPSTEEDNLFDPVLLLAQSASC